MISIWIIVMMAMVVVKSFQGNTMVEVIFFNYYIIITVMMSGGVFNTVLYSPPQYIIDVISSQESKINGGTRWTDVSVKFGEDLNTVRHDLLNLATATGSNMYD